MALTIYWLLGAALAIAYIIFKEPESGSTDKLARVGIDPGKWGLKLWVARIDFLMNGHRRVQEQYTKCKDTNFVITTLMTDQVVLAPKFLSELRMLPEQKLNSSAALVDSVLGSYSGVDIILKGHLSSDICRGQLTKNLPGLLPQMISELQYALPNFLNQTTQEEPISCCAYDLVFTVIQRVSSRVFVGKPFCYEKAWIDAVKAYPMDVELVKFMLIPFPAFLRPMLAPLLPAKWRLSRNHANIRNLLFPSTHVAESDDDLTVLKFLQHTSKDTDPDSVAQRLLVLTAAALHTSSMAAVHVLYDLCAMPQYVEPLREEARLALTENGGLWNMETIQKLHRLDSFLKESQRLNTSSFLGFDRKAMSPIKLSDGTTILPGTTISMAAGPLARDPAYYSDPLRFDGFRFNKLRSFRDETGDRSETEYTSIEPGNLTWGNGRFTCPGRWYAGVMIKLLIANIILEYQFEYPKGQKERTSNTQWDTELLPDFKQSLVMRRRQTSL